MLSKCYELKLLEKELIKFNYFPLLVQQSLSKVQSMWDLASALR